MLFEVNPKNDSFKCLENELFGLILQLMSVVLQINIDNTTGSELMLRNREYILE